MLTANIYNISVMMGFIIKFSKLNGLCPSGGARSRFTTGMKYGALLFLLLGAGCSSKIPDESQSVLLHVGDSTLTVRQFESAVGFALSSYGETEEERSENISEIRSRVLAQLTEEMLWLEHARVEGVALTRAEIDQAVNAIKVDYPAGEFEKIFAETAVAYADWEQQLSRTLLVRKMTDRVLGQRITVSAQEVQAFARQQYRKDMAQKDSASKSLDPGQPYFKTMVKRLRQAKRDQAYVNFLATLKKRYVIDFNQIAWDAAMMREVN